MLKALYIACIVFEDGAARVNLSSQTSGYRELDVGIIDHLLRESE